MGAHRNGDTPTTRQTASTHSKKRRRVKPSLVARHRVRRQTPRTRSDMKTLRHAQIDNTKLDVQYSRWFNRCVVEFMNIRQGYTDYEIRTSYVHNESLQRYLISKDSKILEKEQLKIAEERNQQVRDAGTLWTGHEKRIFFKMLERYSIHRVDEWLDVYNGEKSKYEIMAYYNILKYNLRRLQEHRAKNILERTKYPIAYEMDEQWIEFEEIMARRLTRRSNLPFYFNEGEILEFPKDDNPNSLIDMNKWNERWCKMYKQSNIWKPSIIDKNPSITNDAMLLLAANLRRYLSKILWYTMNNAVQNRSVTRHQISKWNGLTKGKHDPRSDEYMESQTDDMIIRGGIKRQPPRLITSEDVQRGLMRMELDKTQSFSIADNVIRTLDKFDLNVRMDETKYTKKKKEEDYDKSIEQRKFRSKHILNTKLPEMLVKTYLRENVPISNLFNGGKQAPLDKFDKVKTLDHTLIQKLCSMDNRLFRDKYTITGENEPKFSIEPNDGSPPDLNVARLDSYSELQLLDWETERLEAIDRIKSKLHSRSLWRYFSKFHKASIRKTKPARINMIYKRREVLVHEKDTILPSQVTAPPCPIKIPKITMDWHTRT